MYINLYESDVSSLPGPSLCYFTRRGYGFVVTFRFLTYSEGCLTRFSKFSSCLGCIFPNRVLSFVRVPLFRSRSVLSSFFCSGPLVSTSSVSPSPEVFSVRHLTELVSSPTYQSPPPYLTTSVVVSQVNPTHVSHS